MNKKFLTLLIAGVTLGSLLAEPVSTVSAAHSKVSYVKKHSRKRIPYKAIAGAAPVAVHITHKVRLYSYNLKTKKMYRSWLGASRTITVKPGNHNSWIVVSKIGYNDHGYLNVIKQYSGWYITQSELNQRLQNQRNKFNSSIANREGSNEYRAWQNKLNSDRNNIHNWINSNN